MTNTRRLLPLVLALGWALPVSATPILSAGIWTSAPASNSGDTPYSHLSWDCEFCNLGYEFGPFEYLGDGGNFAGFALDSTLSGITLLSRHSAWTGTMTMAPVSGGAWALEYAVFNEPYVWSSLGGSQIGLLRKQGQYFACVEDIPRARADNDCQDAIYALTLTAPTGEPSPVPEPSTLVLLLSAGVGVSLFRRRPARQLTAAPPNRGAGE